MRNSVHETPVGNICPSVREDGPKADLFNEDCVSGMGRRISSSSVHLTITSIPFEELCRPFTYSGKLEDVGNNGSTVDVERGRFAHNMQYVISELFRVTAPGCNVCIHIQQLLAYKNQHGFIGKRDFRGAVINWFIKQGFEYKGEAAIVKDPQAMAQRLNLHSLQFKTGYARNGCNLAPAPNDFLLIFQKPGEHPCPPKPLRHIENPTGWLGTDDWVLWARGSWEIDEFDVLDGARYARESTQEKHVCPLQLEIIRRAVLLYTNPRSIQPNVTVLDPFMGIGSTAFECILHDRNVVGFELKESYFNTSLDNVDKARAKVAGVDDGPSLFDVETEAAA